MPAANQNYYLIVGLGNPGQKYLENRHNIGWLVFDEIREIITINGLKNLKVHLPNLIMVQILISF